VTHLQGSPSNPLAGGRSPGCAVLIPSSSGQSIKLEREAKKRRRREVLIPSSSGQSIKRRAQEADRSGDVLIPSSSGQSIKRVLRATLSRSTGLNPFIFRAVHQTEESRRWSGHVVLIPSSSGQSIKRTSMKTAAASSVLIPSSSGQSIKLRSSLKTNECELS